MGSSKATRNAALVACAAAAAGVAYQKRLWVAEEREAFFGAIHSFYVDTVLEKGVGSVYSVPWGLLLGGFHRLWAC
jgi:hypothetical protein